MRSPAISLGFTTFGWDFCVCDRFFNPTIKVVTFRLHGWCVLGVFFVAGIHPSRTWTSGSFESVRWNACVYRLDLGLYSHPKEFWGNGVWTHVNSKGKIPSTGKCSQRRIEPATPWTASPCTTNWAIPAPGNFIKVKEQAQAMVWYSTKGCVSSGIQPAWGILYNSQQVYMNNRSVFSFRHTDTSLHELVRRILPLCSNYSTVVRFIEGMIHQHSNLNFSHLVSVVQDLIFYEFITRATLHEWRDRLVGLVVRRPPRERKIPGSNPACAGIFSGSSHTSDLKIGTPVATLPGAWCYRVSAGTGRPGVSILWLGEVACLIYFYLSVATRKIVWADPSLRYTSLLLAH